MPRQDIERERREIRELVGQCIMAWSMVERAICALYTQCVDAPPGGPAPYWLHAAIFDTVISIDARLDMIEAAIRMQGSRHFSDDLEIVLSEWTGLKNRLRKRYKRRNEIAHSDIAQGYSRDGKQDARLLVFPTLTGATKFLNSSELRLRASLFEQLAQDVMKFESRIASALRRPPVFLLPSPNASLDQDED